MGRRNLILLFIGKLVAYLKSPFLVLTTSLRSNKVAFVSVLILFAAFISPVLAQDKSSDEGNNEQVTNEQLMDISPVIIDGNELFNVIGLSALPSEERATSIVENILRAADSSDRATVKMEIRPSEFGPELFADDIKIITITTLDADYENTGSDLIAVLQNKAVEEAIIAYRLSRSEGSRIESGLVVLALTVAFGTFTFLFFKIRHKVPSWVAQRITGKLDKVETATNEIVRSQTIGTIAASIVRVLLLLFYLINFYYYLSFTLRSIAETRSFAGELFNFLTDPVIAVSFEILGQVPNVITLLLIGFVTRFVIKTTRLVFENIDSGALSFNGFEKQWVWPTYKMLRVVIVLLAIVFAFPYIPGSDSAAFKGVSILIGVMMSLGSSSVVGNLLAGIFVIYKRSTNIGDRIKVGEHIGDVVAIRLMETHLKSLKNELISIPNSQLLGTDVVNYTSQLDPKGLLVHTTVGIGYEEPQRKIEAMLITAAERTKNLKRNPKPFVLRTGLMDFAVNYQINAYSTHGDKLPQIMSDLHSNILDVFNEERVQIMTPSYVTDTAEPKIAPVES